MQLLDADEIRLLTEVGFLASARGDIQRAEAIFGALERVRPQRDFPYVGLATCYLNTGRADDAVGVLERAARQVRAEDQPQIAAFRALALQLARRAGESARAAQEAGAYPLAQALRGNPLPMTVNP